MPRRAIRRGFGHLLLASPDCTIAAPNLPLQAKQVLICFPAAPTQRCQSRIGRRARRDRPGAEHIIGPPVYLICPPCLPTSRLYLAPSSAPHDCIQPYPGTVEPRHLTASSRYSPGKHWYPPPIALRLSSAFSSASSRARRVVKQSSLARVKLCLPMSQNVSATCTADVTAPLANSSPKSRLAIAVEPPDQPPRYPPPDRIHPQGPRTNCREPPLRFRLHIRP